MKLAELHLDWIPVIPGGKVLGENHRTDLRDCSTFRAADGWDITCRGAGEFELMTEGLPTPVVVGDGYSYTRAVIVPVDTEAPVVVVQTKGKKR